MKTVQDCKVKKYTWLNNGSYIIEVESPEPLPVIFPGNFAEIRIDRSADVFLRRPFSILDVDYSFNSLSFFVKIIGKGTRALADLAIGESLNLIYPLGNTFTPAEPGQRALIVAGGSGIAPFILLAKELTGKNSSIDFIFGGKSADDIHLTDVFAKYGRIFITTEDGSLGEQGLVTQHPVLSSINTYHRLYCCGPEPMMKAIAEIATHEGIECEVSLENTMACGFGACLCCVVDTQEGHKCVCTEGPVFNIKELKW